MYELRKKSFINLAYKGLAYLVLASLFFGQTSFIYAQEENSEASVSAISENSSANDSVVNLEAPDIKINIRDLIPTPEESNDVEIKQDNVDSSDVVSEESVETSEDIESIPEPESLSTNGGVSREGRDPIGTTRQATMDTNSGSLSYSYDIVVPPGRNGLQPNVSLVYNSDNELNDSYVGYGWSVDIPYISRLNKKGTDKLYTEDYFSSSLTGELELDSGINYKSKVDNGEFINYEFDNDIWIAYDKNGTKYTFGLDTDSRQDDGGTKIYKWMLQEVRDTNDNYVKYEYFKDEGQIYPETITYTGNGTTDGIFVVEFNLNPESMSSKLFSTGFSVKTDYQIESIKTYVDSELAREYNLTYSLGDAGYRKLLESIEEVGRDENNVPTESKITTFTYKPHDTYGWATTADWQMPIHFVDEYSTDHNTFIQVRDVNGDSYPDVIYNDDDHAQETYINDTLGTGWDASYPTWEIPVLLADDDDTFEDYGTRVFDFNGDLLTDLVRSYSDNDGTVPGTQYTEIWQNTMPTTEGWATVTSVDIPIGFVFGDDMHADNGTQITDFNGDGILDIVYAWEDDDGNGLQRESYIGNGDGSWTTVSSGWEMPYHIVNENPGGSEYFSQLQIFDINGDFLPDIAWSKNSGTHSADERVYINNGEDWNIENDDEWYLNFKTINDNSISSYNQSDYGTRVMDLNGDGISDFYLSRENSQSNPVCNAWINSLDEYSDFQTGSGWVNNNSFVENSSFTYPCPEVFANYNGVTYHPSIVDINADGMDDVIFAKREDNTNNFITRTNLSQGTPFTDKLIGIETPEGAESEIEYKVSTKYRDSSDNLLNPNLPIIVTTVKSITTDDGMGNTSTEEFSYSDGHYFYGEVLNRKFAGFGLVEKIDGVGNITKTYFHQGNDNNSSSGEVNDSEYKIGKPYLVEQYDDSSNLYKSIINVWDEDLTNRNFVFLSEKITLDSDGNNSVHKDSAEAFTYDNSNGNLLSHVEYGEGTYASGSFTDTGTDDRTTNYLYATGSSNNVIGLPYSEITTDNSSAVIKETQYHYDGQSFGSVTLGNVTDIYKLISGSTYSHEQKMYDIGMGLVTDYIDANNKTTLYNYDTYSLYPIEITDGNSNVTRFDYDYSSGKVTEKVDPSSNIWTTIYDGLDRATEEIVPAPSSSQVTKTRYIYDDVNIPNSVTQINYLDGSLSTESITYIDGLGRTIQERSQGENDYSVIDTMYDDNGRIWKKSLPYFDSGSTNTTATTNPDLYTENIYDPLDRVVSSTNAVGTTEYVYDQWKTTVTDANNHDKSFYKDAYNNLVQVDEDDGNGIASTYYDWDMLGNLINITDALGNVRNFTYDNLSRRLTAEDLHDPLDTYFGTWTYTYDDVGNLATVTDPNSNYVTYTYDGINRILTEDLSSSTGTDISYTYGGGCTNGDDRLCSVILLSGDGTDYDYDEVGNIVLEDKTISAMSNDTIFTYDYQSNITSITDSYSNLTEYTYNSAGRIENIDYTPNGGSSQGIIDNFDYSSLGQITEQEQSNGVTITNTYNQNELYRLNQKVTTDGITIFQDIRYLYDPVGNILEIEENSTLDSGRIANYEYDWLNRLLQAEITATANSQDYTQIFRYDALGNIVQKDLDTYDYDGNTSTLLANPHAVTSIGIIGYSYDNSGNLVSDGTFTYTWNYKNQMTQAASTGVTADYTYDENGQRTSTTSGGIFTIYPNKYLDMDVNYSRSHVYAGDQLVATIDQGGVHYNSPDHLNSSAVITDSSGNLEQLLDYYPFGGVRFNNQSASFNERNKYIGQEFDEETGLNYMNARYQNSSIGKFISQDPEFWLTSEEWLFDPQNQNSYSYARNNPISLSDPSGRSAIGNLIKGIKSAWNNIWNSNTANYQSPTNITTQNQQLPTPKTTTWDPVTDQRISQLDPRVQQPATNFINNTESELNVQLRVVQGYRSIDEQNKLYAQGRTAPGNKVTNAKGGESYHNYGLAVDVVRMENGQPNWKQPITEDIANIGIQQGFSWGGSWNSFKDYPHFEMPFGQSIKNLISTLSK
jgi:RHS repeat-associated protein